MTSGSGRTLVAPLDGVLQMLSGEAAEGRSDVITRILISQPPRLQYAVINPTPVPLAGLRELTIDTDMLATVHNASLVLKKLFAYLSDSEGFRELTLYAGNAAPSTGVPATHGGHHRAQEHGAWRGHQPSVDQRSQIRAVAHGCMDPRARIVHGEEKLAHNVAPASIGAVLRDR